MSHPLSPTDLPPSDRLASSPSSGDLPDPAPDLQPPEVTPEPPVDRPLVPVALDYPPYQPTPANGQGRWRWVALGVGAVVVLGGGGWFLIQRPQAAPPAEAVDSSAPAPSQTVTTAIVQTEAITQRIEATGTVQAHDLLPIVPQSPGLQIQAVLVDEGMWVKPGQVLAQLDRSVLQSQIAQAQSQISAAQAVVRQRQAALAQTQATLQEAQANRDRFQTLAQEGAVSQQELDTRLTTFATAQESVRVAEANIASAQADLRSQQARLKQLQTQMAQTQVIAPAGGLVAQRWARVGNLSSNSDPLFSIIRDGRLELEVPLPETQLPQVKVGAGVQVRSDSDPGLQLQGTLREIAPLIDPQTREARLKIDLPSSQKLRPGMFLRATVLGGSRSGFTVPAAAVLPQADGTSLVYRLGTDNQVQAQPVTVGQILGAPLSSSTGSANAGNPNQGTRLHIVEGLAAGDRVVVEGAGYLKDGDTVQVVPATP